MSSLVERMIGSPEAKVVYMMREAIDRDPGRDYHWGGNVRELEQEVRRILITRRYQGGMRTEK